MAGLLDFFTGSGDYADPEKIDPRYGVPMSDVRQAALNSIGNMGAILMAAGQRMEPAQRAAYLAQLGQAGAGFNTDLYNSAQRRLMQSQYATKMEELADDKRIREDLKDPAAFQQKYGFNPAGLGVSDVRQAIRTIRTRDPNETIQRGLQIQELQRRLATPETKEVGGALYERQGDKWVKVTEAKPAGGLEGDAQSMIIAATKDPRIAETPEYSIAFNRMFGPKLVQAFNPSTQQMEYTWATPPVPNGVIPPKGMVQAAPAGAPAAASSGPQATVPANAPAPGTTSPIISQRPPEPKPLTEDQARSTGFAKRMVEAAQIIDPMDFTDAAKPGVLESVLGPKIGQTGANLMRGNDRQLYRQAQENWVRANLRKESGAVIGTEEMAKEIENYFPQIGDGPAVIEQKRRSREAAMQGMITSAGPGAERAGIKFKPYEPPFEVKLQSLPVQELLQLDTSQLDDKQKAAYLARLRQLNVGGGRR